MAELLGLLETAPGKWVGCFSQREIVDFEGNIIFASDFAEAQAQLEERYPASHPELTRIFPQGQCGAVYVLDVEYEYYAGPFDDDGAAATALCQQLGRIYVLSKYSMPYGAALADLGICDPHTVKVRYPDGALYMHEYVYNHAAVRRRRRRRGTPGNPTGRVLGCKVVSVINALFSTMRSEFSYLRGHYLTARSRTPCIAHEFCTAIGLFEHFFGAKAYRRHDAFCALHNAWVAKPDKNAQHWHRCPAFCQFMQNERTAHPRPYRLGDKPRTLKWKLLRDPYDYNSLKAAE